MTRDYNLVGTRVLKRQNPPLRGADVRRLQQTLKHLGFFLTRVDGVFGDNTQISVRKFQKVFDLNISGEADKKTIEALNILIDNNLGNWTTFQRDCKHTGHSKIRIPMQLRLSKVKRIPEIISINSHKNKLVITSSDCVHIFGNPPGKKVLKNTKIKPTGHSTIGKYQVIVPTGCLTVIDIFSGKTVNEVDISKFTSPVARDKDITYASSDTGTLYCLDKDYFVIWKYKTDGPTVAPTVGYDSIYVTSTNGTVYCIDNDGSLNWETRIRDIITIPLSIFNSKVFVMGVSTGIHALNPLTGDVILKKDTLVGELTAPAFGADFMVTVNDMCEAFALSTQDLKVKWKFKLNSPPSTPPIVCHDTVFFGTKNGLIAYNFIKNEHKTYIRGKKITSLAQVQFDIYASSELELFKLSPEI